MPGKVYFWSWSKVSNLPAFFLRFLDPAVSFYSNKWVGTSGDSDCTVTRDVPGIGGTGQLPWFYCVNRILVDVGELKLSEVVIQREEKSNRVQVPFPWKSRQISKEYRQFFIAIVSVFRSQLTTDQRSKERIPSTLNTDISLVIVLQTVQNNTYLYGICYFSSLYISSLYSWFIA